MNNVTVTCGEIQTDGGFEFKLPSDLLNQTLSVDCEQSWYLQDGHLIADPSDPQTLIDPVMTVKSDRLVTSYCVNLKHEIICDSTDGLHFSREIMFRVRNETAATPNSVTNNESESIRSESGTTNSSSTPEMSAISSSSPVDPMIRILLMGRRRIRYKNGRLIDPSDPQKLMDPVISVSSDRLVTSYCVDELHHEIICHSDGFRYQTIFRDSISGPPQTPESNQIWWISVLIFIVLLVLICFLLWKRIFRDPETGVQMKLGSAFISSLLSSPAFTKDPFKDGHLIADPSDPQRLIDPATSVKYDRLFTSYCVNLNHEIICDSPDGSHYSHEIMFRVTNETNSIGPMQTPASHVVGGEHKMSLKTGILNLLFK
ncbi:hypothetical protein QQF64_025960 [Cirrhinus molitorella]|uniref:Uncharacterized protein n=1 Tax=Cirrhinus molitorella TaxID=172907 RepID=A0ABR3NQG2_9TELE